MEIRYTEEHDFTREELHFYENCGFVKSDNASPMFITSLWT